MNIDGLPFARHGVASFVALIAIMIVGSAIAALISGLTTTISNSARHREMATANTLLRSYAEAVKQTLGLVLANWLLTLI